MSEFKKTRDASTWQKLPPPKSLRGEEDAEVTWDLILKRYPNAAPLLCQMETVIERAEGLLEQLRSPYTHVLERSSSFQIADSEDELMGPCNVEESTEVSMISEQDSRLASVENMTPELASIAGCSLSDNISDDCHEGKSSSEQVCSIDGEERPSEILKTDASVEEQAWSHEVSSSSIYDSNSKYLPALELEIKANSGRDQCSLKSTVSSVVNVNESPTTSTKLIEENPSEREVGKSSSSLEAWGKVVGEKVNQEKIFKAVGSKGNPSGGVNSKEDSVSEHTRRLTSLKSGPMQQITKLNLLGKKEELVQRFAGTIRATASKIVDTRRMVEKIEGPQEAISHIDPVKADGKDVPNDASSIESSERKVNELGERRTNPDSAEITNTNIEEPKTIDRSETSLDSVKKSRGKNESSEVQGNGDEAVATVGFAPRSPVEILEEYSKICGVPVEYKNLSPSCSYTKSATVGCCLGEYASKACAESKKTATKDAAANLLRSIAGKQIDGENTNDLKSLTRKQMEEIISLGNGSERETAVRKLYKMCIKLNAPEPTYEEERASGILGDRFTVRCEALGISTTGYGLRPIVAKRVAADQLLQSSYRQNPKTPH